MVSQRSKRPAASQASGSSRRRRVEENHEEEEEEEVEEEEQSQQAESSMASKNKGGMSDAQIYKAANQLVRMALFSEYRKVPVRRDEIVKKVLGKTRAAFAAVFEEAQTILKHKFGLELYELRVKSKGSNETEVTNANSEAGVVEAQTKAKVYIVRTLLPFNLRSLLSVPDPLPISAQDQLSGDEEEELVEDSGAILDWKKGDGTVSGAVGLNGICWMILAIILVSGRAVVDSVLYGRLRRFALDKDTVLPFKSTDSTGLPYPQKLTLDKYLDVLVRQGYLEKHKLGQATPEGLQSFEYKWGPRADAEMGERAVADFITEIFVKEPEAESESESETEAPQRRRQRREAATAREEALEKAKDRVVVDIAKAAGSALAS